MAMRKGENYNASPKGTPKLIEPIRNPDDIKAIKKLLQDNLRDLALFVIGINTNLRAVDLVRITIGQVEGLKLMEHFVIIEKKTKKRRKVYLNNQCITVIRRLLRTKPYSNSKKNTALFKPNYNNKTGFLNPIHVNYLVRKWCKQIGLKAKVGAHTLRKTWGYHSNRNGTPITTLVKCFNHSTQRQTLDYLCIDDEQVKAAFKHEI